MKTKKIKTDVETQYGSFLVTFEPDPDMGGYMIAAPKRPDVISWGKNLAHAKQMAKEAIECSIEGEILISAEKASVQKFISL
jgi:predicted RNase H-like HicB family nuclease